MTAGRDDGVMILQGNLVLSELSAKKFPDITAYQNKKVIDLQQITNIDSAGIAYLVQIKTSCPGVSFKDGSDKVLILADLYGVSFFFK
ncbi:lipid asymmetry maintenance protein MlaB [Psychromonas sp.]|uniref:STAS domain-containing protein n=1 Tax=Psychromonas sp. TaxID=1884585 RepID=UPI003565C977